MQHTYLGRPSWRGILAGLLMGLVVTMAMLALALVLSSFLSLDLRGAGVAAGVYTAITALVSAFTAGYFAVKASAPEALLSDGTAISPKNATLTGLLTAAAIIVMTTFGAMNGAGSVVRTAGSVAGSTVSALGGVASGAASSVGSLANGAVGTAMVAGSAADTSGITNQAKDLYQKATGNLSRHDIENFVAKNSSNLSKEQVSATTKVIEELLGEIKTDAKALDLTDLQTWQNLDEIAKNRFKEIEAILTGDELITRLQAQGLSEEQALKVREEAVSAYQEYRTKSEELLAQANQSIEDAKLKAAQALEEAEAAARKAAFYTGLFGLISMLLTFIASIAGAKKAAASYVPATTVYHDR